MRDDIFVTSLAIDWAGVPRRDAYPFDVPAIASLHELDLAQRITFFCGENGTGKSTLLEAMGIAYGLNPEGGSRNYTFSVQLGCFNTWVESWDVEDGERTRRANVPKQCNHCENPQCVKVCPTGASYVADDGTVQIDAEKCIGCKYCLAACPYQARYATESGEAGKCSFCHHRTTEGMLPACVGTCVTSARFFGDLDDPDSDISKKLASGSGEVLNSDLGLSPSLYYFDLSAAEAMPVVSAVHRGGNVYKPFEG